MHHHRIGSLWPAIFGCISLVAIVLSIPTRMFMTSQTAVLLRESKLAFLLAAATTLPMQSACRVLVDGAIWDQCCGSLFAPNLSRRAGRAKLSCVVHRRPFHAS